MPNPVARSILPATSFKWEKKKEKKKCRRVHMPIEKDKN
jgi:hypothetical protein